MHDRAISVTPHALDAPNPSALGETHILEGPVFLRHNGGPAFRSDFRMVVEPCGVSISYSDGVTHLTTDPAVIAFFLSALVPSLQAAERD